jgi:ankyrin repeat protein
MIYLRFAPSRGRPGSWSIWRILAWALLAGWILGASVVAAENPAGELRLVAVREGREFDAFQVRGRQIFAATPGGLMSLDGRVEWRIEGDLAANADRIDFQPHYRIHRRALAFLPEESGQRFQAVIDGPGNLDKSVQRFDPAQLESALAVVAWVVDRRVVRVMTAGLPDGVEPKGRSLASIWISLRDEDVRGAPVVMVWSKGRFLAAAPSFADLSARQALVAMFLGSDADFSREIEKPGVAQAPALGGVTLLHVAAGGGFERAQELLLARGARSDSLDAARATPLVRAMQLGRKVTAADLIRRGALQGGPDADAAQVLADLYAQTGSTDLPQELLDAFQGWSKWKLLLPTLAEVAARTGEINVLQRIAAQGAGNLLAKVSPATFLHRVREGDIATVELLLANKYNVRSGSLGSTALHAAARADGAAMAALLLRAGARSGSVDAGKNTPLMLAARMGSVATARELLSARADPGLAGAGGGTALHFAVAAGDVEMVQLLLGAKARLAARDEAGRTPLALALGRQDGRLVEALAGAGGKLTREDTDDESAIEGAIALDRPDLLAQLRSAGWSPAALFRGGWSAWALARLYGADRTLAALGPETGLRSTEPEILNASAADRPPRLVFSPPVPGGRSPVLPRQFQLRAVVDAEGTLRFPRLAEPVVDTDAVRVVAAVMDWRFEPASKAGKPVNMAVQFPLTLSPAMPGVLERDEVDRPSLLAQEQSFGSATTVALEAVFPVQGRMDQYGQVRYTLWNTPLGEFMDAVVALDRTVSVVVESDGSVGAVYAPGYRLGRSEQIDDIVAQFRFSPAVRNGRPVRSRVTLRLVRDVSSFASAPLGFIDPVVSRAQERGERLLIEGVLNQQAQQAAQMVEAIQQRGGSGLPAPPPSSGPSR